jgi:hypothetical protein
MYLIKHNVMKIYGGGKMNKVMTSNRKKKQLSNTYPTASSALTRICWIPIKMSCDPNDCFIVVLFCVMCVVCVLCLIVVYHCHRVKTHLQLI